MSYPINWNGNNLKVIVSHDMVAISNNGKQAVRVSVYGKELTIEKEVTVKKK